MGEYFDLGDYSRPVTTSSPGAQLWFDRGLVWAYGFQPRRGGGVLRAGDRGRPAVRARVLGTGLRAGTQLQQALGGVRPGRAGVVGVTGLHRRPGGRRPGRERVTRRARAGRRPGRPVPVGGPRRGLQPLERRVRRRHARGVPISPRRPGRGHTAGRRADEPHAVGAVGPVPPGSRPAGRPRPRPGPCWSGPWPSREAGPIPGSCTCTST